jgi:hypothetical protein
MIKLTLTIHDLELGTLDTLTVTTEPENVQREVRNLAVAAPYVMSSGRDGYTLRTTDQASPAQD